MIRLGQRVQDLLFQLHLKQERIDALESGEEYIRMEERLHRELAYQDRIIKDLQKENGRTEIEKVFKTAKEYLELLPLNKWTNDTVRGKILNDIIGTIIVLLMRKELRDSKKSIPDMIGATQSLMCVRDDDYNVTIDTANKQTRETFEAFHIPVPAHLDARVYWTTISGK